MDVPLIGPCLKFTLTYIVISTLCTIPLYLTAGSQECSAAPDKAIGYTEPAGDIVLQKGELLNITCTINSADPKYANASDMLYFGRNNETISHNMIDILGPNSIRLSIEPPKAKADNYICYFNNSISKSKDMVCYNVVTVGVQPQAVEDFSCIGRNYDSFTCSWTPPENFVKTDYNLTYTFKYRANRAFRYGCPLMMEVDEKLQCFWNLSTRPLYRQAQETFYFTLRSNNTFGSHVNQYIIHQFQWVIPNKPEQLTVVQKTAHSVALNWTIPPSLVSFPKGLHHRILYKSEFDLEDWQKVVLEQKLKGPFYNLTGLSYAHALYDIRVSMRSAVADKNNESMWSDFAPVTVRTDSEIPDCPPKTTPGSFEIGSTNGTSREVYVYWQKIQDKQQNGEHFKYMVEILGHDDIQHEIEKPKTYVKFRSLPKIDVTINIWSENEKGRSLLNSTIVVPAKRLPVPRNFVKVERGGDTYELSWDHPDSPIPVTNYTIFWCNSERDRPYKCDGVLNWTFVPPTTKRFNKTFSKPRNLYQFAISTNTPEGSSEMVWATCIMIQRGILGQMKNVWFNNYGSNFVELNWKIDCHDGIDIVKGFIIYYCPVKDLKDDTCNEKERSVTIDGDKNLLVGNVTGLKPHTMYRFAVAAKINDTHYSLRSEYKYNTTSEAAPSTPPLDVELYNITESSISIKWSEPKIKNGAIAYYRIYYNNNLVEVGSLNIITTNHTLTGLMSYENYSIKMQACTKDCSMNSTIQTVTTKIGIPSQIEKPYINTIQNDILMIKWSKPEPPRGPINYYQLQFMEKYGDDHKTYIVNVTEGRSYKIDNCGNYASLVISVRAVNINKEGVHKKGNWSESLELDSPCSPYSKWIYIPIILLFFVVSVVFVYYAVKKCYNKYTTMKNIEVKLPPGLDPVVPWDIKHAEDVDHQSRADEALLLDKMPEVRSGESSGCSSGNESMTCSESPTQTANSDSGTEQQSSLTDENIRFRKNVSSKGGYVLADAIQWGSSKPAPNPASNYCVLGVDPSSNQNQPATTYVPSSPDSSPTSISMPYLSTNTTTALPSSYSGSEFVKTQNPNYVPFIPNEPVKPDKSSGYVVAGVTKDLMAEDMMVTKEENSGYLKGSEFAPNIQFPWQMQESNFSKAGYVSVGDALPPPKVNKGYVPHRQFDTKPVKGD